MALDNVLSALGWDESHAEEFPAAAGNLVPARAIEAQRGFVKVASADGEWLAPIPPGLRRRPEPWSIPGPPATGDWLAVEPGGPVHGILPRRSALRRYDETAGEEVLVANVDLVLVVTSLNRDLNLNRIERLLALADEGGIPRMVVLSKSDLSSDADAQAETVATALHAETLPVSAVTGTGVQALQSRLAPRRTTVLLGSSGVGKSTLVNTLLGASVQRTVGVRETDDKGRHTTTSRTLLPSPHGALVVDTPGLRSPRPRGSGGLPATFPDVFAHAAACRFADCTHAAEPGCAVRAAVAANELPARRVEAMLTLEAEAAAAEEPSRSDSQSRRSRRRVRR